MGYIVLGLLVFIFDIMTKLAVELNMFDKSIPIIEGVFHLTYVENRGIAFGLFSDARILFIIISILVLIALAALYSRMPNRTNWLRIGTSLIYGGAMGNLLERMAKGYVVDFLDFRIINFPVFNFADIAVCVGAVLLVIHFIICDKKNDDKENTDKKEKDDCHVQTDNIDSEQGAGEQQA